MLRKLVLVDTADKNQRHYYPAVLPKRGQSLADVLYLQSTEQHAV